MKTRTEHIRVAKLSVIIPTRNAAAHLPVIVPALNRQTQPPHEIIIVDSASTDGTPVIAGDLGCIVHGIPLAEFDHGATRTLGAELASGDILVYMTQDAEPADDHFLANLTTPIASGEVAAAYARHLPRPDASPTEAFARRHNFPPTPHIRSSDDIARLGVRAYFFSDTAAAVDRRWFAQVGGYPHPILVNEDMLLCSHLLQADARIAYAADAQVYHSHHYSLAKLFGRYFDIGTFLARYRDELPGADTHAQGWQFFRALLKDLAAGGKLHWWPRAFAETAVKLVAVKLGGLEAHLPHGLKKRLSGQKQFWQES